MNHFKKLGLILALTSLHLTASGHEIKAAKLITTPLDALLLALHETTTPAELTKLLDKGWDPNGIWECGITPLWLICRDKKYIHATELAAVLLHRGADLNARGYYDGKTPLHIAALSRNVVMVKFLLAHGANPNAQDNFGRTPLHKALTLVNEDTIVIVELLLQHGADPNVKDISVSGETPLKKALWKKDSYEWGLRFQRNPDPKKIALERRNHADAIRLLLEHGAK